MRRRHGHGRGWYRPGQQAARPSHGWAARQRTPERVRPSASVCVRVGMYTRHVHPDELHFVPRKHSSKQMVARRASRSGGNCALLKRPQEIPQLVRGHGISVLTQNKDCHTKKHANGVQPTFETRKDCRMEKDRSGYPGLGHPLVKYWQDIRRKNAVRRSIFPRLLAKKTANGHEGRETRDMS